MYVYLTQQVASYVVSRAFVYLSLTILGSYYLLILRLDFFIPPEVPLSGSIHCPHVLESEFRWVDCLFVTFPK